MRFLARAVLAVRAWRLRGDIRYYDEYIRTAQAEGYSEDFLRQLRALRSAAMVDLITINGAYLERT